MPKTTESVIYLLSNDRPLFEGLSALLRSLNADQVARLVPVAEVTGTSRGNFDSCDTILCDMREKGVFDASVYPLFDRLPSFAPIIGLEPRDLPASATLDHPFYLRLSGIASMHKGWNAAWDKIIELRRAWKSPYMHSRIEDVSPSDVLQMIGVSQWTAIVRVQGSQAGLDTETVKGCISFCKGMPECAWSTHHTGLEAIWELISLKHGVLDVVRRIWPGCVRNVHGTIEEILLTHALDVDESHPSVGIAPPPAHTPVPAAVITWIDRGPLRALDSFWNKHRSHIAAQLGADEKQEHPLRWMKWRELERLAVSELQTQFLFFWGDVPFIQKHLGRFSSAIGTQKPSDDAMPVLRAGKIGQNVLYLIGIREFDPAMRVLSRFPFILDADDSGFKGRFAAALKAGARGLVLVASDAQKCLADADDVAAGREWNGCCITDAGGSVAAGNFSMVAEALSLMAAEKNT